MPLVKAKSNIKAQEEAKQRAELLVSDEAQNRLAEIISDAPRVQKFGGTEWAMRPLRNGTEYLIVDEVCKHVEVENAQYGDVLIGLRSLIPVVCKVLTLALLNDKYLIYQNGDKNAGFSKLYNKTYDTIMWSSEKTELSNILLDCLQMVDVSFFIEALGMLQIFRASVTEKKRTRAKSKATK